MAEGYQVSGDNADALFTLKVHRGDGMALLGMNWKDGEPPGDFVGFAIEYKEPGGDRFYALKNRLGFPDAKGKVDSTQLSTRLSPIQKFRWVHFPRNAEIPGAFEYRVTPVFMNAARELSYGEAQHAAIALQRETYPGQLNIAFTRGFVSSQAFVDRYGAAAVPELLPAKAEDGLDFTPSLDKAEEALAWMGFEARNAILELLDQAIADDKAKVRIVAYDLNMPEIVSRLKKLKKRVRVIIDDDGTHGEEGSAENAAEEQLKTTAGAANVKRQHMGKLQHNKMIVVQGPKAVGAVCGSTNFSWRGFYVQNNNAIVLKDRKAVAACADAFDCYWENDNSVADFAKTDAAPWHALNINGIDADIAFSPRTKKQALLTSIAKDIQGAQGSVLFSLAFLYQTPGAMRDAFKALKKQKTIFSYGISDHAVEGLGAEDDETEGLDLQKPDGSVTLVYPAALEGKTVPEPFKSEPKGGGGARLHHKFVVVDFDKPSARVYVGSFNFSGAADTSNGENLLLIRDRRIATSYMIEALRIFDHYHFRVVQLDAKKARKSLHLALPPRKKGEKPWWKEDYVNARKILDRRLFS